MIVLALAGAGFLVVSSIVRAQWAVAGVAATVALATVGLLVLLDRRRDSTRFVAVVVALMLLGVPPLSFFIDLGYAASTVPLLAVAAVAILSLLWPIAGLAAIALEAVILAWAVLGAASMTYQTIAAFLAVAFCVYMFARSLLDTQSLVRDGRLDMAAKTEALDQTLRQLQDSDHEKQDLLETIRSLEAPLIESERGEGLLVVVGHCDLERVQGIQSTLASRLSQRSLDRLVIDISNAQFDEMGLDAFLQMLQAWRLSVSSVVVSGMASGQAQELAQDRKRVRRLRETVTFVHSLQDALAG
jgi:anti-anti-sigma regulatory factor